MLPDTRIVHASARHVRQWDTTANRTRAPSAHVPSAAKPDTSHANALFAMRAKFIIQEEHAFVPCARLITGKTNARKNRVPSAARPDTSRASALIAMRAKLTMLKANACVPRAVLTTGKTNARKICARTARNSATLKSAAQGSLHRHAPHVAQVRTKRPEHSIVRSTNARHARANSNQKATTTSTARRARATRASFPDTYRMCARFENATTSRSIF